jgi:cyclic peptide transporter
MRIKAQSHKGFYDKIHCSLITISLIVASLLARSQNPSGADKENSDQIPRIEKFISEKIKDGSIPGMAVVVLKNDTPILKKTYGYSDENKHQRITNKSLFELGSNSKAFTALGILYLEKKGLLKLNDPVTKYLPWFNMAYHAEGNITTHPVITIENLLHHSSGIPFNTINLIEPDTSSNALENTVKKLVDKDLGYFPGSKFLYATINYDILGLVIEKIAHQPYESFIRDNILLPLGLKSTFLDRVQAGNLLTPGYKFDFLTIRKYDAPFYRGNVCAGYFISDIDDLQKWLSIQIDNNVDTFYRSLIELSHVPDRSVVSAIEGYWYGGGWFIYQGGDNQILHNGANPNYSSFLLCNIDKKLGIAVLANINSEYTSQIGKGILKILENKNPAKTASDQSKTINIVCFWGICITIAFALLSFYFSFKIVLDVLKGKRKYNLRISKSLIYKFILGCLFIAGLAFCLYLIPEVLYDGLSWNFFEVWSPFSLQPFLWSFFFSVFLFQIYCALSSIFIKEKEKPYYLLAVLSILSGIANVFVIFIINKAITGNLRPGFFCYFIYGNFVYVYSQRIIRVKLITTTNNLIHSIKMDLVNKILRSPFYKIEKTRAESLVSTLNYDTQEVGTFPGVIVNLVSSAITIVCCFTYLAIVDLKGFLIAVSILLIVMLVFYLFNRNIGKIWFELREKQNELVKYLFDMMKGFKELKLNYKKSNSFEADLNSKSQDYMQGSIYGSIKVADKFIMGQILFSVVIGIIVFVFPIFLGVVSLDKVRIFVLVFLYMTGSVNAILNSFPPLTLIKASWKRIEILKKEITSYKLSDNTSGLNYADVQNSSFEKLQLLDIEYHYHEDDNKTGFKIGPITMDFNPGEIIFITGGNGSGKSSLAKLLTGLYIPEKGRIVINEKDVSNFELNQKFTAIFSDYHLFDKLYGIQHVKKQQMIIEKLKVLQLQNKTSIDNGIFKTINLSTGQRKRLALLVSYLDDKPIYLFDEWASDQDPEFRNFFYNDLLPELKNKGKCVIVISHDDRYYNKADRLIRMEMGKILKQTVGSEPGRPTFN